MPILRKMMEFIQNGVRRMLFMISENAGSSLAVFRFINYHRKENVRWSYNDVRRRYGKNTLFPYRNEQTAE